MVELSNKSKRSSNHKDRALDISDPEKNKFLHNKANLNYNTLDSLTCQTGTLICIIPLLKN